MRWRYGLVLLLALELALWECFLTAARPFGVAFPLSAALAVVANPVLSVAGARVLGRPRGAYGPSFVWLVVLVVFALPETGGYAVVPGTARGVLFLLGGMAAAAAVPLALSQGSRPDGTKRSSRTTPGDHIGR